MDHFVNQTYEKTNFLEEKFILGEYENCIFDECNFANLNLSKTIFIDCEFRNSNLTMANVNQTAFKQVRFLNCRLLGVQFNNCNNFLLSFGFEECYLNLASFYDLNIKGTLFENCSMQETDFAEANLSMATFENCDLDRALFDNTNLEKADLSTAYNYTIDPEGNRVNKACFSLNGVVGLLGKYDINVD